MQVVAVPSLQAIQAPVYVLYHANCFDGFGAAFAAWKALGDDGVYIPVTHGQPPPEVIRDSGCPVVIIDFSYPRDVLLEMRESWGIGELTVIDHHVTAEADLHDLDFAMFDMGHSGAVLAWQHWHPHTPVPSLLLYLEDRDLWRFDLPKSRELSAGLQGVPFDFAAWDELNTSWQLTALMAKGEAILAYIDSQVHRVCQQARLMYIDGHAVAVVNATAHWSEVGEYLLAHWPDVRYAASYFDRADGKRQWSLRSLADFDVSCVAKGFGGGGHKQAAGFVTVAPHLGEGTSIHASHTV